jgi:OTU domain-containing protein 6
LYDEYCDRVANTSDWGGQLELRALACSLATPIEVFSAESDVIKMGTEFSEDREALQLTYHLHYYTLGEHFNSVAPL